jgi:hypothetical protein
VVHLVAWLSVRVGPQYWCCCSSHSACVCAVQVTLAFHKIVPFCGDFSQVFDISPLAEDDFLMIAQDRLMLK